MRSTRIRLSTAIGVLVLFVAACGGSNGPNTTASANTAGGGGNASEKGSVSIADFSFQPSSLTVPIGTTVTWTNNQGVNHTVTADDGSFDSGNLAQGAQFSHTFTAAGTYAYHCTIHQSMKATIVVEG